MKNDFIMKKIFLLITLLSLHHSVFSGNEFSVGSNVVNVGFGLGGRMGLSSGVSSSPGIGIGYELGYWDMKGPGVISLGGYLGYKAYSNTGNFGGSAYTQKWNYTLIGFRSAYHYNGLNIPHLDPYGGAMLSYNALSYRFSSGYVSEGNIGGSYASKIGLSLYLGSRYYFNEKFAAYAELGFGIAHLTIGASYRF